MSESSQSQILESWISSFCGMTGHEYFAEVSEDFIEDDFNLTGLSSQVPFYKEALEVILDVEPAEEIELGEDEDDDDALEELSEFDDVTAPDLRTKQGRLQNHQIEVETAAEMLYGLIHQRYITSRPGISQMHEKYELGHFGHCPRVHCNLARVLPVGCSDIPGFETVKLFCPSCLDVYTPPNSRFQNVDGAFFGTTFGSLFLMTYPDLQVGPSRPELDSASAMDEDDARTLTREINGVLCRNFAPGLGVDSIHEPRVFGFKVAEISPTGPRMRWLRLVPDSLEELDETAIYQKCIDLEDDVARHQQMDADTAVPTQGQQTIASRKKAPLRRRRQVSAEDNAPALNGVG